MSADEVSTKRPLEDAEQAPAKRAHVEEAAVPAPEASAADGGEEAAMNEGSSSGRDRGRGRGRGRGRDANRGGRGGGRGGARGGKVAARDLKLKPWEHRRGGKQSRNEEDAMNDASGASTPKTEKEGEDGDKEKRLPKKRAAVLVGYCGTGYSGMQIQTHGSRTIEGDIFAALAKAGAVSEENAVDHRKVDVQRAARTDAGVHAAGNCISLKMILDPPVPAEFPDLTAYVNSFLPDQIRMWGFVRAMKSFQARQACDSRVYEYLLPSYCLLPPASSDPFGHILDETSPGWKEAVSKQALEFADAAPAIPEPAEGEEIDPRARGEFERRRGWRIDADTLQRFRNLIAEYKGTHNFHNYTVGKPFRDVSVKRFMISLEVRDPAVYGDIEWISVRIHGQSFMLHQIRKMMSMAMLACRTGTPPSLIPETFNKNRIHIPKAPPLGLLLEQPQFKTYNQRARGLPNPTNEKREDVDFDKYKEKMHEFKVTWIYERLREVELESNVFHKWMRQIDCTNNKGFSYLNTEGKIPEEALVTLTSKKYGGPGGQPNEQKADKEAGGAAEVDSDDEEVDAAAQARGELDG